MLLFVVLGYLGPGCYSAGEDGQLVDVAGDQVLGLGATYCDTHSYVDMYYIINNQ